LESRERGSVKSNLGYSDVTPASSESFFLSNPHIHALTNRTCRDLDKRFCPSCGNATLLRTTVSTSAKTGKQTVHLKKNFQYALRGSKFTIPDSKAGRAKGQQKAGNGLILREDQREWQDAVKSEDIRKNKEERKLAKGVLEGWDNPDVCPSCAF
jgi:RNA-binding protein NOB1